MSEKKCPFCGENIKVEAIKCRYCGEWLNNDNINNKAEDNNELHKKPAPISYEKPKNETNNNNEASTNLVKSKTTAWVLSILLGAVGGDQFYLGNIGGGFLMTFCTFWPLILVEPPAQMLQYFGLGLRIYYWINLNKQIEKVNAKQMQHNNNLKNYLKEEKDEK